MRFVGLLVLVLTATCVLVASSAGAGTATCDVRGAAGGFDSLQAAVDAAQPGSTLMVRGTCVGDTVVDKSLTITGKRNAVLDGGAVGTVLTVDAAASVTVSNLTVTNGSAGLDNGGGISNFGTLTVQRATISDNFTGGVGGGIANEGTLVVDRSTISGKVGISPRAASTRPGPPPSCAATSPTIAPVISAAASTTTAARSRSWAAPSAAMSPERGSPGSGASAPSP
jgi:hypothetical protein